MVTRRAAAVAIGAVLAVAALAYLRDPPWLISETAGLRQWEQRAGTPRYRWSGARSSFYVRADAGTFDIPVSTTFDTSDDRPMMVTVSVDGRATARIVLTDGEWKRIRISLPPPGSRRVRRIEIRTSVARSGNFGVRVGEIELVTKTAVNERILSPISTI